MYPKIAYPGLISKTFQEYLAPIRVRWPVLNNDARTIEPVAKFYRGGKKCQGTTSVVPERATTGFRALAPASCFSMACSPSAAKAEVSFNYFAARLKSCPDAIHTPLGNFARASILQLSSLGRLTPSRAFRRGQRTWGRGLCADASAGRALALEGFCERRTARRGETWPPAEPQQEEEHKGWRLCWRELRFPAWRTPDT